MVMSPVVIIGKVVYDATTATPPLRPMSDTNITDFAFRVTFDLTSDENVWSGLAGAVPFSLVRTGFDQMAVQRFMAARTLRDAKRIALAGPLFVLLFFFVADCAGIAIIYWFRDCDPLLRGDIESYDQERASSYFCVELCALLLTACGSSGAKAWSSSLVEDPADEGSNLRHSAWGDSEVDWSKWVKVAELRYVRPLSPAAMLNPMVYGADLRQMCRS
ncbi:uncharacterized protein LOC142563310 [Dermacentor variabilis]|uniref:uncharacterized protein LOC142563310 n=1 Tax=Dermacentor variabilis TaxID=34621 RepID=UPI003F5B0AB9